MQTIYWKRQRVIPVSTFIAAVNDCKLVCAALEHSGIVSLVGLDTKSAVFADLKIEFNGLPGVEPFIFHQQSPGRERNGMVTEFCKTHGLAYESAVLACLEIFNRYLSSNFEFSMDGPCTPVWPKAKTVFIRILGWHPKT